MTNQTPSVAVLVSSGRHPITGVARASRRDAVAMAVGHALVGPALRVVHFGDPADPALEDYLALGAGTIEVIPRTPGADKLQALRKATGSANILLMGERAEGSAGSGLLPYRLAHALGRPVVADVLEVRLEGREASLRQFLPKGKRRAIVTSLPVVLAVHPLAPVSLRYAHARRASGEIAVQDSAPAAVDDLAPEWTPLPSGHQPVRLKAPETKTGHERLLAAISAETRTGVVVIDGSHVEKAQVVLSYLRKNRLVDV